MVKRPLISIIVITYNSAEFVLETLESIKLQTYKNMELIITDDCSNDDTNLVCQKWLDKNQQFFKQAKMIKSLINTGVSANLQRGVNATEGEWIKLIAGDDLLLYDCIENYVKLRNEKKFDWAISKMKILVDGDTKNFTANQKEIINFFKLEHNKQYKNYAINPFFLNSPSGFYNASILRNKKIVDISFPWLEDQPIFLNLLKEGYESAFLNKATVVYRINPKSITTVVNVKFYQNLYRCYQVYRIQNIPNTFLGRVYKKSIEGRFKWLINTYTAKNKFQIILSFVWQNINNRLAQTLCKTIE